MSSLTRRFRALLVVTLMAGFIPLTIGCSSFHDIKRKAQRLSEQTTRKIVDLTELKFTQKNEKKKIAIGPITDRTPFEIKKFGEPLQKHLVENLKKKCSKNIFLLSGDAAYPKSLSALPRNAAGRIDNVELMNKSREAGLNAVVSGTVIDIREFTDERGMLWFRDTHKFLQVLVNIEAYDTETGAKLTDESYLYETELDIVEFDDTASDKTDLIPIIDEAIADAAQYLADHLCYAFNQQEWTGFVTAVEGSQIHISSGIEMGLSIDQVLDVYDPGTIIQGVGEQRFFKPGRKIGAVRITSSDATHSVAEPVSEEIIPIGSRIKLK